MKKTKLALFHSVIALLLCFSMLVGTTFAWFTDSVSTTNNLIVGGNLDVELEYLDAFGNWQKVTKNTNVFEEGTLWEPGHTEVVYLRISNKGSLALKYQLGVNIVDETGSINVHNKEFKLSDYIYFDAIENVATAYPNREAARGDVDSPKLIKEGYSKPGSMKAGDPAHYVALVVYMPESVGNDANYKTGEAVPSIDLGITLMATQYTNEQDSFGEDYDDGINFPALKPGSITTNVNVENGKVAEQATMAGEGKSATVPAGVALKNGVNVLTLSVALKSESDANLTLGENELLQPLDVHVEGVADDNTVPLLVTIEKAMMTGLNIGNYKLYHVENGMANEMISVNSLAELDAHNEFYYDPATGHVTLAMATFSEVALVADTENAWNGTIATEFAGGTGTEADPYIIANADQLAYFGAAVGGMIGENQNSFSGKYIKLISDINLGYGVENHTYHIFYPIGYYNNLKSYTKQTDATVTSDISSFEGTFDGNGHTIKNFYQNTWEMFGDYNNGYTGTPNHYKDAMGLFGYVVNGKVCNLTVKNFSSDGEFTPTGVIAAYAVNSTFENIAITNCNPRVYNTGNGGIVGVGGNSDDPDTYKLTFTNITIDNSNIITSLWGSWDTACGGLVGMFRGDGHVHMTNCHVAAQIDVYNDVCGNYQYYWYRYSGMMVGTNKNMTTDANGYTIPETDKFHAENCTVHFGDWNDYYYCELVANSLASYTHDHQFSRLTQIQNVSEIQDANGNWSKTGNFILMNGKVPTETCYHIMKDANGNLYEHKHDVADATNPNVTETVNGATVLKENNQRVFLPFNQLFTGYGWGVKHVPIYDDGAPNPFAGVTVLDRVVADSVEKFKTNFTGDFLYRVGNQNTVSLGSLFDAVAWNESEHGVSLKDGETGKVFVLDSGVWVTVEKVDENMNVSGTFTANSTDWKQGTIQFSGTGVVKVTIQDYFFCIPTVLYLEVVDAHNVTTYSELKNQNSVLLNDIEMSTNGKYSLYDYKTLYGNGFTFNVAAGLDSDTVNGAVGNNGTVWVRNSTLDNVVIVGENYTQYGGSVKSEYNFPTVLVLGKSVIANSYISNGCAAVRVGSEANIEIINTTLEGGIFANLDIRGGAVKLQNVTTINQTDAEGNSTNKGGTSVGLGIVVQSGSTVTIDIDGLTQYNCISKNTTFANSDANTLKTVIFGSNYQKYQFSYNNATWVNTGIVSMVAEVKGENFSTISGYEGQDASISSYNGYVYAPTGLTSVATPSAYQSSGQYQIAPTAKFDYTTKNNIPQVSGSNDYCKYDEATGKYLISFDDGESFVWDANILSVEKDGKTVDFTVSVSNGATVNADNTITFDTAGDYVVTYRYTDDENYRLNNNGEIEKYSAEYERTVKITVYEVVDTSAKTVFAFGSNEFRTETANNLTYVMPDVNATVDSNSAGIGVTTVGGVNIYYPIVSMHKSGSSSWYNYFSVFEAVTITDLNGIVYNTSTTEMPSGLTVIGGFILDANGNVSTAESENGTGIFNYSTGKAIKCATYSTYGLCYYPDSQFTKTGTSDRAEQTIVVKYRYTDSNGTPYYYYVGYWCEKHTKSTICVTSDTLVTLADGTQKRVDELTYDDKLLAWNMFIGEYQETSASYIIYHGDALYRVIDLNFSDGSNVKIMGEHGFFDADLNEYIFIDENNVESFIGHRFIKQSGDSYASVSLESYSVYGEYTGSYSIASIACLNVITNGILSITPVAGFNDSERFFNFLTIGDNLKYDEETLQKDIEEYGLFTYEDLAEYMTIEEFTEFEATNGCYWKIAVGKGIITIEELLGALSHPDMI